MLSTHFVIFLHGYSSGHFSSFWTFFSISNLLAPHFLGTTAPSLCAILLHPVKQMVAVFFVHSSCILYSFVATSLHLSTTLCTTWSTVCLPIFHSHFTLTHQLSTALPPAYSTCFTAQADEYSTTPFHALQFNVDTYNVAFDNCTSYCVTNNKQDYIYGDFKPCPADATPIHGVAGATAPLGFGSVCWHFRDDAQVLHSCCIPHVAFLPDCPIRLCRPQSLARDVFKDTMTLEGLTSPLLALIWCSPSTTSSTNAPFLILLALASLF